MASSEHRATLVPEEGERTGRGQGRGSRGQGGALWMRGRIPWQAFNALVKSNLLPSRKTSPTDHPLPSEVVSAAFSGWMDSGPQTGPGCPPGRW